MQEIALTNRIVQIHLSSWRYFALLTIPPLVLAFNLLYSLESVILLVLFLITHYFCWRLWLDERLFNLLDNENELTAFDAGMSHLWPAKFNRIRSLNERWAGTRGLFFRAMIALTTLWLISLCSIAYLFLTLAE